MVKLFSSGHILTKQLYICLFTPFLGLPPAALSNFNGYLIFSLPSLGRVDFSSVKYFYGIDVVYFSFETWLKKTQLQPKLPRPLCK